MRAEQGQRMRNNHLEFTHYLSVCKDPESPYGQFDAGWGVGTAAAENPAPRG